MIVRRPSKERGHFNHGWLDTYHSFSFASYHDPAHMGFRGLRVINEDRVAPARGFGAHPHRDMEIITYVLAGALEHRDSMGNHGLIRPDEVQRMSAGTGVVHSEANPSRTEPVHLLQIWIEPSKDGIPPSYEQKTFPAADKRGRLRLVAAPDGAEGAVTIHTDAKLYATLLDPGRTVEHTLAPGRHAWVHVVSGSVDVGGVTLETGDGAAISGERALGIKATEPSEVLLFDLA
jgi:quercetin 2,3-dioxygenase